MVLIPSELGEGKLEWSHKQYGFEVFGTERRLRNARLLSKLLQNQNIGSSRKPSVGEDLELFLRLLESCKVDYLPTCVFRYIKEASELSRSAKSPEQGLLSAIDLEKYHGHHKRIYLGLKSKTQCIGFDRKS